MAREKIVGTSLPLFSLKTRGSARNADSGTVVDVYPFLDWLAKTKQHAWQLLPLSQTHFEPGSDSIRVPSPYRSYGIGLNPRFLAGKWASLKPHPGELSAFLEKESAWLNDYAAFCALSRFFKTDDWSSWKTTTLRRCQAGAVSRWVKEHQTAVSEEILQQWRLAQAFHDIRNRAHDLKIEIIGDLPFYLPLPSPLVWAHQDCFEIDDSGRLSRVSGVPDGPDSHFGRQVWGHPLYRWRKGVATENILRLWQIRLDYYAEFYDRMRLDHAKGFFNFGVINPSDETKDRVKFGPGEPALAAVVAAGRATGLELFAEDLGDRLKELRRSLKRLGVPGIRILRFAYNEKKRRLEADYSDVANYPDDSFAYTTTHDTFPLISYVKALTAAERRHLCLHVGVAYSRDDILLAQRLRQAVIDSPAGHVIIPLQDWLLLPDQINRPGSERLVDDPNWRWRMPLAVEDLPRAVFGHRPTVAKPAKA